MIKYIFTIALLMGNVQHESGLGILGFRWSDTGHVINKIHSGSPAEGVLQIGDKVIAIDDDKHKTKTIGEPGTQIKLTIKRGNQVFDVTLVRVRVQDFNNKLLNKVWGVKD